MNGRPAPASQDSSAFVWRVRVYWEDTDAGGIVFYANYLKFFERARTEWLRSHGIEQHALKQSEGLMFVVTQTQVRHVRTARLDDELDLTVAIREAKQASLTFAQQALHRGNIVAEGEVRVACVDAHTLRPRRFPTSLMSTLA